MSSNNYTETKTLKVGDKAPDFTLRATGNREWHLADFRGKKNVVLAFVPFAFSGICSAQIPAYDAELDRFKSFDTEVVSISMDSHFVLSAWSESMDTSIPLLSDFYPQGKVVDLYGVRHAFGMPERSIFVIDKEGIIRSIEVTRNPEELPDDENMFEALRKLV